MKKQLIGLIVLTIIGTLFISCATGVSIEEFSNYKSENEANIRSLVAEIENAGTQISALQNDLMMLNNENIQLKKEIDSVRGTFTQTYSQIEELTKLAGYSSSEDFLHLATDIVNVTKAMKDLNLKIENLRNAMATFVNY